MKPAIRKLVACLNSAVNEVSIPHIHSIALLSNENSLKMYHSVTFSFVFSVFFFFFAWKDTKSLKHALLLLLHIIECKCSLGIRSAVIRHTIICMESCCHYIRTTSELSQKLFFVCLTGIALSFIYSWIPEVTDSYSHEYKEEPKTVGQIGEIWLAYWWAFFLKLTSIL